MTTFTFVHVVLSLVRICSGFVVMFGLFADKRLDGWTALCLASTVATSVSGASTASYPPRQCPYHRAVLVISIS